MIMSCHCLHYDVKSRTKLVVDTKLVFVYELRQSVAGEASSADLCAR